MRLVSLMIQSIILIYSCFLSISHADTVRMPFYLVEKDHIKFYILGTFHLGIAADYPFRPEISTALDESSHLIMELSPKELNKVPQLLENYRCEEDCLFTYFDNDTQVLLEKTLNQYPNFIQQQIRKLPPLLASSTIGMFDYLQAGFLPQFATEHYLIGAVHDKPIIGLETAESQLELLGNMPIELQKLAMLQYLLMPQTEQKKVMHHIHTLWQTGDAQILHDWSMEMGKKYTPVEYYETLHDFNNALIYKRNIQFIKGILPYLQQDQPIFVAVGALHLGGDKGMLTLLEKMGFIIKAL